MKVCHSTPFSTGAAYSVSLYMLAATVSPKTIASCNILLLTNAPVFIGVFQSITFLRSLAAAFTHLVAHLLALSMYLRKLAVMDFIYIDLNVA